MRHCKTCNLTYGSDYINTCDCGEKTEIVVETTASKTVTRTVDVKRIQLDQAIEPNVKAHIPHTGAV